MRKKSFEKSTTEYDIKVCSTIVDGICKQFNLDVAKQNVGLIRDQSRLTLKLKSSLVLDKKKHTYLKMLSRSKMKRAKKT